MILKNSKISDLTIEQVAENLSENEQKEFYELVKKAEINFNKKRILSQIEKLQAELEGLEAGNLSCDNAVLLCKDCHDEIEKVGVIANTDLRNILESGAVDREEIVLLKDKEYCKKTFNLNYPLLSKERRDSRGYARYYKMPVVVDGEEFYLCSHWIKSNMPYLQKWIKRHVKTGAEIWK